MKWVKQYGEWTELYHKHDRDCYECQFKENGFGSISINENNTPPQQTFQGLDNYQNLNKPPSKFQQINTATPNLLQNCKDLPCKEQFKCLYAAGKFPDFKTALKRSEQELVVRDPKNPISRAACIKASRGLMPYCCNDYDPETLLLWASIMTMPISGPAAAIIGGVASLGQIYLSFRKGNIMEGTTGLILSIIPFIKITPILKSLFATTLLAKSRVGGKVLLKAEEAIKSTADALDKYSDLNDLTEALKNGKVLTQVQKEFMDALSKIPLESLANADIEEDWQRKIDELRAMTKNAPLLEDRDKRYEQINQLLKKQGDRKIGTDRMIGPTIEISASSCDYIPQDITKRDENVFKMQTKLKELELFEWEPDGKYGKKTEKSVSEFQKKYGLKPIDGCYGPKTAKKLEEIGGQYIDYYSSGKQNNSKEDEKEIKEN